MVLRSGIYIPERQTLKDLGKNKDETQSRSKEVDDIVKNSEEARQTVDNYNVLAHLRKIFALLCIFDALMM